MRDQRGFSADPKSVVPDRGYMGRPTDQGYVVPLREQSAEEAPHRSCTEHENLHTRENSSDDEKDFDLRPSI
jgi:hypothetical protein